MTRRRALTFVLVAGFTAVVLYGGSSGLVTGLFGPRVMLDVSAPLVGHPSAPAASSDQAAAPALHTSGVSGAAARVLTTVSVAPATRELSGFTIEARLATKDGKPLAETEVAFYDVVTLMGPREMLIGTAKTDGHGSATINYLPPQLGTHTINVRPTQWDRLAATQATATFDAIRAAPVTYARERLPLEPFSLRLPAFGIAAVAAVYAIFAFVVLGSLYFIPRSGQRDPYMGRAREV